MAGPYPMAPDRHGNPRWRVLVYAGVDAITGRDRQITKVVRGTKAEAQRVERALRVEADQGRHSGTGERTLGQALDGWLAQKEFEVERTTWETYKQYAKFIPERLRARPVGKVTVEELEALYHHLRRAGRRRDGKPLGGSAVKSVHLDVRGALEYARRRKWVAVNVAEEAVVPTGKGHQPSPYPAASVAELRRGAALEHPALPTYVRVAIAIGARPSELHGLRWSGVDFERARIHLRDVIVRGDEGWIVKPRTKTGGGRTVAVDAGTMDALRAVQAVAMDVALQCGTTLRPDAFVFSDSPDGSAHWYPRTTAARFKRVCARLGLPPATRLYDLRHLMATHCIDEGVPITAVSGRLAHAQNSTTLDLYAGRVPRSDLEAARVMGRLLDGEG